MKCLGQDRKNNEAEELFAEIAAAIIGEFGGEEALIELYDLELDSEEFIEKMLDFNVEHCDGCGRWYGCEHFNEESGLCVECDPVID